MLGGHPLHILIRGPGMGGGGVPVSHIPLTILKISHIPKINMANIPKIQKHWGPQGFWGSGENGYLFSGSSGSLVIILVELGKMLLVLLI